MKNERFINRDISWLSFNHRVFQEAQDKTVPIIERFKFLGIFSNNRDEFFRVRVGTLRRIEKLGNKVKGLLEEDPTKILTDIQRITIQQEENFKAVYENLLLELREHNIHIVNENGLNEEQKIFVKHYFKQSVLRTLVPIMLDTAPVFPELKDASIYLFIQLVRKQEKKRSKLALIEVPTELFSRFLILPENDNNHNIILLDDVIRFSLKDIFSIIKFDHAEAYTIKITRDAELDIDNDVSKSLVEKISISLKKREQGRPVKLAYDREMPAEMLRYLVKQLKMKNQNVVPGGRYHNFKDFINFPGIGDPKLQYPPKPPLNINELDENISKFKILRKKDILLSYPYQSYLHVIDLLREASIDPKVESISITLYRVAKNSNIVRILLNALKNGKTVTAVVELKARFDEEANIYWANQLQEEGANVIYVVSDLKVHAKLFIIRRRENMKHLHYAHIGTGNFNESTAKIYSDHSLLTTDPRITTELIKLFNFYATNYKVNSYKHLLVAPFFMRKNFVKMIGKEIQNAKEGKEAYMILKMNSLVDHVMIEKLYEASKAGVKIKLIIRGICSLVTGIPGVSDNIEAISIVDRYLEHARVFIFCNGGEEKYYISSADWMTRNLSFRSEVAVPIYDRGIQKQLKDIINIQLRDNTKARIINRKQTNPYKPAAKKRIQAQDEIYQYLSNLNVEPEEPQEIVEEVVENEKKSTPVKRKAIAKKPRVAKLLQPKDKPQQS